MTHTHTHTCVTSPEKYIIYGPLVLLVNPDTIRNVAIWKKMWREKILENTFFYGQFSWSNKKKWNEIDHRKKQNDPFFFSCLVPTMIILLGKWRKYQWKINVYFSHGLFWPMVKKKQKNDWNHHQQQQQQSNIETFDIFIAL